MSDPQPEASGSTTARKVHHLATFVFDAATLNRETYTKLIEHDGVVHRLVQRLMEKHPVDDTLRLGLVITPSPSVICSKKPNFVQDYLAPSSFLGSLPKLASRFVVDGSGQRGTVKWPGLDIEEKGSNTGSGAVLNGIVAGIELLDSPTFAPVPHSPPSSWASLTPASGRSVLDGLYQPTTRPVDPAQKRYLINVLGSARTHAGEETVRGWDASWDGAGWEQLGTRVKEEGIRCSAITCGFTGVDFSGSQHRLGELCYASCDDPADEVWFPVPQEVQLHLGGFAIDKATLPSPAPQALPTSAQSRSSALPPAGSTPTEQQKQQLAMQRQALQMLQAQAVRTGSATAPPIGPDGKPNLPPAVLQSLMMAAKNGNLDMNNPALQQFKHLMMLQQQQKANQAASGGSGSNQAVPSANANPSASQPGNPARNTPTIPMQGVPNMDQMIQQAVKQQQIVQQQPGYGQGHNGAGMGNGQQQAAAAAAVQAQQTAQQQQIAQQQQQLLLQQQQQQQQMLQQQQMQQQQQQLQQQQHQQQQQSQPQPPQPPQRTPSQQSHAPQPQQQQQLALPPQANQPEPPARPDAPPKIWTGDLIWHMPNGGVFRVSLDSYPFNERNANEFQLSHWPSEFKISHMRPMPIQDLQQYARNFRTPIVSFQPSQTPTDVKNFERYTQLAGSFAAKSQIAIIPLVQEDRGILIFASPGSKSAKLMGVVCLNVPLPQQARPQSSSQSSKQSAPPQSVTPQQVSQNIATPQQQQQQQQQLSQQGQPVPAVPQNYPQTFQQQYQQSQAQAQVQAQNANQFQAPPPPPNFSMPSMVQQQQQQQQQAQQQRPQPQQQQSASQFQYGQNPRQQNVDSNNIHAQYLAQQAQAQAQAQQSLQQTMAMPDGAAAGGNNGVNGSGNGNVNTGGGGGNHRNAQWLMEFARQSGANINLPQNMSNLGPEKFDQIMGVIMQAANQNKGKSQNAMAMQAAQALQMQQQQQKQQQQQQQQMSLQQQSQQHSLQQQPLQQQQQQLQQQQQQQQQQQHQQHQQRVPNIPQVPQLGQMGQGLGQGQGQGNMSNMGMANMSGMGGMGSMANMANIGNVNMPNFGHMRTVSGDIGGGGGGGGMGNVATMSGGMSVPQMPGSMGQLTQAQFQQLAQMGQLPPGFQGMGYAGAQAQGINGVHGNMGQYMPQQ